MRINRARDCCMDNFVSASYVGQSNKQKQLCNLVRGRKKECIIYFPPFLLSNSYPRHLSQFLSDRKIMPVRVIYLYYMWDLSLVRMANLKKLIRRLSILEIYDSLSLFIFFSLYFTLTIISKYCDFYFVWSAFHLSFTYQIT